MPRVLIDNIEIEEGSLEYKDYTRQELFVFNSADLNATIIKNLNLSLEGLRIIPKDGYKDVLNLDLLYVKNVEIKPFMQDISVEKIGLDGLKIKARRGKDKHIDWLSFIKITSDDNDTTENVQVKPWNVLVQDLSLQKIKLSFLDEGVRPSVTTSIDELNVYLQNVTLAGIQSMPYNLNIQVNKNFKCSSSGTLIHQNLDIKSLSSCKGFDVTHYEPYLQEVAKGLVTKHDLKLISGVVGFELTSNVKKVNDTMVVFIDDANISVDDFILVRKSKREKLLGFKHLDTNGLQLDTQRKSIEVKKVSLDGLNVYTQRYKNKSLNIDYLVVGKKAEVVKKSSQEKAYHLVLKEFFLANSGFTFKDSSLEKVQTQKIDRLNLHLYNIDSNNRTWFSYKGGLRLNRKGNLYIHGKIRHTPLKQVGRFALKDLDLGFLNPYLQESTYLNLSDGKLSFEGKSSYSPSSVVADLQVNSSFALNSLTLNDMRKKEPLLFVNKLQTKSITLELFPNRLYIDEVNIENFYTDVMIDENRIMNFAKLSKFSEQIAKSKKVEAKSANKDIFPIKILKVNISKGSAKFSDYSIPIRFSTYIHNLDGVIYAISNTASETTYINIAGDVDEYGSAKLEGSVESYDPKSFTDLNLNFQNLELNSLSGYSASFAGHEIDSGKLYLDLGYDILDSQLKGSNSIMMKNVVLGKEIDDENITVLPLGFVLGLLEDSDGVIDIEMPVEGNVDEPDFKYGTLVLKTIGGLITKAITSPFKFLGAAMGIDAEALEYIYFAPGTSVVTPPEREKLDQLAKMMLKKPKINLKLASPYAEVEDKQALQMDKLIDLVMKKSGLENRKEHKNAMTSELLEDIYEEVKDDESLDKLREKLASEYNGEVLERIFHKTLVVLCRDIQVVRRQELQKLATARAQNIYIYLSEDKSIARNRLVQEEIIVLDRKTADTIALHIGIEIK